MQGFAVHSAENPPTAETSPTLKASKSPIVALRRTATLADLDHGIVSTLDTFQHDTG